MRTWLVVSSIATRRTTHFFTSTGWICVRDFHPLRLVPFEIDCPSRVTSPTQYPGRITPPSVTYRKARITSSPAYLWRLHRSVTNPPELPSKPGPSGASIESVQWTLLYFLPPSVETWT